MAVVGGGNTAIINAIYLSTLAKKVYLIVREETIRGEKVNIDELLTKENIEIIYNSEVTKYLGDTSIKGIVIKNKDNTKELAVDGIFLAIGQVPETKKVNNLLNLDKYNYIEAKEDCQTNIAGIFAAGDVRSKKVRQLTTATNDGTIAALNVINYLNEED